MPKINKIQRLSTKEALKMMSNKLNKPFPNFREIRAIALRHLYNRDGRTDNTEDENNILNFIIDALSYYDKKNNLRLMTEPIMVQCEEVYKLGQYKSELCRDCYMAKPFPTKLTVVEENKCLFLEFDECEGTKLVEVVKTK